MIPLRVDTMSGYFCRFAGRSAAAMLVVLTFFTAAVFAAAPPERIKVTATIFPLADIVRQVGGNRVHVVTLLPPGVRPYSYQPTLIQIRQTLGTSLYIRVGSGFDAWSDNLFGNAAEQPQTLTVTDLVDLLPLDNQSALLDKSTPGQAGKVDPWVWLDPVIVRDRILPAITAALIRLRPGDARYFKVNERKYFEELTKLDEGMRSVLMRLPGKGFVSTHPIWGYLAKRYGLRQAAVIEPAVAGAPAQRNQDTRIAAARKHGIVAVFGDPWSTVSPARKFAERIHGRFVMLDPLGGAQLPGRYSYSALMKYNLALIQTVAETDVHMHSPGSRGDGGKAGKND